MLYAKYHFYSEVNVMKEHHYPALNDHQILHSTLINDLNNKMTSIHLGLSQAGDVERFLIEWFTGHTANEDAKFGKFLAAKTGTQGAGGE